MKKLICKSSMVKDFSVEESEILDSKNRILVVGEIYSLISNVSVPLA